jgi:hypothetical protein
LLALTIAGPPIKSEEIGFSLSRFIFGDAADTIMALFDARADFLLYKDFINQASSGATLPLTRLSERSYATRSAKP